MELREAIEHCDAIIKKIENCECRKDHEKLKEFMEELRDYRDTGLTPQEIIDLKEQNMAKPVKEVCGVCGEKYECPNCGSVLQDMDVFAGYCKWCGQRIKLEDDNEQI